MPVRATDQPQDPAAASAAIPPPDPNRDPPHDLFTPAFHQRPHTALAKLRDTAPAVPVMTPNGLRTWLITGYEDARALLADPRLSKDMRIGKDLIPRNFADPAKQAEFLQEAGERSQFPHVLSVHMLDSDPPDHTRLRRLVGRAFTARRVESLRPRITELTDELLAGIAAHERIDLMEALAFPVPFTVICWLLGVPPQDRADFRRWSNLLVSGAGTEEVRDASADMIGYLRAQIAAKRSSPADDMLSDLILARDDGDRLTEDELLSMAFLLLVAGHETTVNLIGNGALALLTHPQVRERLLADDALWPAAVEEFLRYDGPVANATWRFTTEPVQVGEVVIPEGEFVSISIGAAGRDPRRYPDPDRLDIDRPGTAGLAFGHGIHHCLGAPLARLEGRIVLGRLFARLPGLRLAADPAELRWRSSLMMRGLEELPVLTA
ncbi:cytochrome P450 family protein [Streptomyces albipurpureus]|uniref:Cytochrome P450 n=1 Tax=Streptomyces albipurpureus TaxID=2897419 RepID=A0ABT0UF59_9ACTN|nr:cytochrome P450 [Streptomyces sp. CWNU-1]MCM2387244.1 cytochrome P450 [Streptomyces sp. CWNU-1]